MARPGLPSDNRQPAERRCRDGDRVYRGPADTECRAALQSGSAEAEAECTEDLQIESTEDVQRQMLQRTRSAEGP